MLHSLWRAAIATHGGANAAAENWVRTYAGELLTRPVVDVVAGLCLTATQHKVTGARREPVET